MSGAKKKVAVLPGDGIGPEIVEEAVKVLHQVERMYGCTFEFQYSLVGERPSTGWASPSPMKRCNYVRNRMRFCSGRSGDPNGTGIRLNCVRRKLC